MSGAKPENHFGFNHKTDSSFQSPLGQFDQYLPNSKQPHFTTELSDSIHTSHYQPEEVSPFDKYLKPQTPADGHGNKLSSKFLRPSNFEKSSENPTKASMFFSEFQTRSKSPGARASANPDSGPKKTHLDPPAKKDRSAEFQKISMHVDDCPEPASLLAKTTSMMNECEAVRITRDELSLSKYPLRSAVPEEGPFLVSDGGTYFGQLKEGRQEGRGRWVGPDGELYEGYWAGGLFSGEGRFINKKGDIYQGEWVKGRKEGKGLLQLPDGYLYRGQWSRDLPHGKGFERDPKGNSYEGAFVAGVKRGSGVVRNVEEKFVYEGELENGHFDGRGTRGMSRQIDSRVGRGVRRRVPAGQDERERQANGPRRHLRR
jgi:hypothetical protein